jgi:hypothetical protein
MKKLKKTGNSRNLNNFEAMKISATYRTLFSSFWGFLFLLSSFSLSAQEVSLSASVNKNPVALNDHFSLTFTLTNANGNIEAPSLDDFSLLYGPGTSTSVQIVNGRRSSSFSYTYTLAAVKEGEFTIQPAKAVVNGVVYESNEIKIKVIKGSSSTTQQNNNNRPSANSSQNSVSSDDLIVKIHLSKSKVYVGESVLATFVLYSRYQALELQEFESPSFNGFWSEEIENLRASWDDKIELINGKQYRKATLRQVVLIPQRSGNIEIDKVKLSALVNASFFNRGTLLNASSNTLTLKVLPLPEGQPANFSGAVGRFELKARTSVTTLKSNDALNYIVELKGRGNLKLVSDFNVPFPGDFEKYDPKIAENIQVDKNGMSGTKKWDYLLIPRHQGNYSIPNITFTYFDLDSKTYRTINSKAIDIVVEKGNGESSAGVVYSNINKQDFQLLDEDIRYINNSPPLFIPNGQYLFGSLKYYFFFLLPAFAFLLIFFSKRRIEASSRDVVGQKMKKAQRKANSKLKKAESLLNDGGNAFYDEIFSAIYGYVQDRMNMGISEMNKDEIKARLGNKKIDKETIDQLVKVLESCEMARFAPVGVSSNQDIIAQTKKVIANIEKQVG